MKDVGHSAPASRLKMAAHAQFNTTSKSGLLVFAGGLVIGGALAAALVYAYTDSSQEGRGRNRKNKGSQRYLSMRDLNLQCQPAWTLNSTAVVAVCVLQNDVDVHNPLFRRPSSPRRRRINYGDNGDYSHVNGNHTPFEQKEKRRQADAASAYSVSAPAEPGRLQVV